jgi:5-methylthioadenosine/S-adenosylhomocysteine deaminase
MKTLLTNAFVVTVNDAFACHAKGAVLVDGARIAYVGLASNAPHHSDTVVRNMGGAVIMPGMVNTHTHGGLCLHRGACDEGDLFEWAAALAPTTSNIPPQGLKDGCTLAILDMVRGGITTACDCARYGTGLFSEVASRIGMRSLSGAMANSPALRKAGVPNWPAMIAETEDAMREREGDGLSSFYLGAHSPYNCTPELLVDVKREADARQMPYVIHAAENHKETEMVVERYGRRPIQHLAHLGVLDSKTVLAHCVQVDDADMDCIASSGASVAHNPISNGKLASGIAPVTAMRRRCIPVGLGTDSNISNNALNLFQEMKVAVLLQRLAAQNGYAMSARDAISMATREGAVALGMGDLTGSLEVGKRADLVGLDLYHPLGLTEERVISDIVFAAGPQHVRMVMIDGRAVFEDGRFTRVDEAAIRHEWNMRYCAPNAGSRA